MLLASLFLLIANLFRHVESGVLRYTPTPATPDNLLDSTTVQYETTSLKPFYGGNTVFFIYALPEVGVEHLLTAETQVMDTVSATPESHNQVGTYSTLSGDELLSYLIAHTRSSLLNVNLPPPHVIKLFSTERTANRLDSSHEKHRPGSDVTDDYGELNSHSSASTTPCSTIQVNE